jgi:hypothetical protein
MKALARLPPPLKKSGRDQADTLPETLVIKHVFAQFQALFRAGMACRTGS